MIINVQQNAPTQQAPPSYGGAPPPPVIAKTSDQIFGTNTGAGFAVASSQRGRVKFEQKSNYEFSCRIKIRLAVASALSFLLLWAS